MRSRNIKPGFFKNDELAMLGPEAMICFAGLWCMADRRGVLEDRPLRIKAEIFPYFDWNPNVILDTLFSAGFIIRYESEGKKLICIPKFLAHQNPHKNESASGFPEPGDTSTAQAQYKHSTSTGVIGLIPDSLNMIPDSSLSDSSDPLQNPPVPPKEKIPYDEILSLWNGCVEANGSSIPLITEIESGSTRRRHVSARWKKHPDLEVWKKCFNQATRSDFLNSERFASFDWITKTKDNFQKVLEGTYNDRKKPRGSNPGFQQPMRDGKFVKLLGEKAMQKRTSRLMSLSKSRSKQSGGDKNLDDDRQDQKRRGHKADEPPEEIDI